MVDYLEHFGLESEPFAHAPVPRLYYASRQHAAALQRLSHVAQSMKGLALLVGDIGHGKTTLARRLLDTLPEETFEAAMLVVVHAGVTSSWLLRRIAMQLGVAEPGDDKLTILSQLYQRLVEIHREGRRAVVLIDEAQMLATRELMEEFRGLLNLEIPGHKLISFIFFGLPELESNLTLDPPLAQRVALRCRLLPLVEEDTHQYVEHRLRLAGCDHSIFTSEALTEVHRWSEGVPRVINSVCDNVLLELFFSHEKEATPEHVREVAHNLGLGREFMPPPAPPLPVEPEVPAGSSVEEALAVVDRSATATPDPVPDDDAMNETAELVFPASWDAAEDSVSIPLQPDASPAVEAESVPSFGDSALPPDEDSDYTPDAIAARVAGEEFQNRSAPPPPDPEHPESTAPSPVITSHPGLPASPVFSPPGPESRMSDAEAAASTAMAESEVTIETVNEALPSWSPPPGDVESAPLPPPAVDAEGHGATSIEVPVSIPVSTGEDLGFEIDQDWDTTAVGASEDLNIETADVNTETDIVPEPPSEPTSFTAPSVSTPTPRPVDATPRQVTTSDGKTINLDEIDDLLADID